LHLPESLASFCIRHFSAAGPPGCTLEQFAMKSERQALRTAAVCALVGFLAMAGAVGAAADLGSGAVAAAGFSAGAAVAAAGVSRFSSGLASGLASVFVSGLASGFVSDSVSGLASGFVSGFASAFGASPPSTARTALWQPGARLDIFFCRHCSASMPPGLTLEQCAMKSERQAERIAARCASLGACANAGIVRENNAAAVSTANDGVDISVI
jgi:hypothetical protein